MSLRLPRSAARLPSLALALAVAPFGQALAGIPAGQDLLLSEVFYDRATPPDDGYQWIEIVNRGSTTIELTGSYSLGWGVLDYTGGQLDLVGSVAPGATFVVGGPSSDGTNFDPVFDQAANLDSDLPNGGIIADGVALFDRPASQVDASTPPIDVVIFGGSNDEELIDESGLPAAVDVGDAPAGFSIARDDTGWRIEALPTPNLSAVAGPLVLSEVFYDRLEGADDGYEWIEILNRGTTTIVLTGAYSLGWGGSDYTYAQLDLVGSIEPGRAFVVGGPASDATNGNPALDQAVDLDGDLQNSGAVADGIALFDAPVASVDAVTLPIDSVIYGDGNTNALFDSIGAVRPPDVDDAPSGQSLARTDDGWGVQANPTPNVSALPSNLVLSEVFYDRLAAPDDGYEWVELLNRGTGTIELTGRYSLGWGGLNYTFGRIDLVGSIPPGGTFVVGGPQCAADNARPRLEQPTDLDGDLQNSGATADAVGLFDSSAADIDADSVPMDAVIYGGSNDSSLVDESGSAPDPDVDAASGGESLARDDAGWFVEVTPSPNRSELLKAVDSVIFQDGFECGDLLRWSTSVG